MKRRIGLIAAAVALALVGTVAVYSYGHGADQRAFAATHGSTVLVAGKRVPTGTTWADVVKGHYLTTERMPVSATPSGALTDLRRAGINGDAVAQFDLAPGQAVLRDSFGSSVPQTGALAVPKGMIATSVSLSSDADVAGYVAPKSQVVIFQSATVTGLAAHGKPVVGDQPTLTTTLVARATVIATSQEAPTTVDGDSDATAATSDGSVLVTLALSQRDAERVIVGQKVGELYLGLLSSSSRVSSADTGVVNTGALAPAQIYPNRATS